MRNFLIYFYLSISICSLTPLKAQNELGFKMTVGAKRVKIPFEIHNNLIVVPVILNNQLPLKFILDTGVRTAILTDKTFTDILAVPYSKKFSISGLGGETVVDAYIANNITLTLPGVTGSGHALLVLEEDYLELRNYLGTEVHGILGYELFSRFIVQVDYDLKILTLTTPEHFKPKRSYKKIDITVEDTKPYIKGFMSYQGSDKVPLKLMIDTGASHGLLLDEESDPNLKIPDKNVKSSLGRGIAGILMGKIARVNTFELGGFCWNDVIVTFPETNDFLDSIKYSDVHRNGSIGGEILSRTKVIFDFPAEKLYLKKGKMFDDDFTYNMSGLVVKAKGSRLATYEIVEVRENSTGESAGFLKGDIILSINSTDVKSMRLNNIINYLNARENKRLRIEILRGETRLKKTFRLKSQI